MPPPSLLQGYDRFNRIKQGNYQAQGQIEEGEWVILKTLRKNIECHYDFASKSTKASSAGI